MGCRCADRDRWWCGGLALASIVPPRLSFFAAAGLATFAALGVLRGAVDVSFRSLDPSALQPGCLEWRTTLPEGRARRLFALLITLMPGTLTARLKDDLLVVHALNPSETVTAELAELEARIARLFRNPKVGEAS
ncbi:Na+/H+ antiporter subunit E (plasmid) [Rhodobacteraceae bacterium SC52]|nr:Na+/H+ antiporter subunit E [Rhodobacteraceae bacterium SC52]